MIMESRNVLFFEDFFLCQSKEELGSLKYLFETVNKHSQDQNKDNEIEPT